MIQKEKLWSEFYDFQIDQDFLNQTTDYHDIFVNLILKECPPPKKILETGVGTGAFSIYFSKLGYNVTGIDNSSEVLEKAKKNAHILNSKVNFMKEDIFSTSFNKNEFDLAFSQGTMEHFSEKQIKKMIKELQRISKKVIFSVPSKHYKKKDYGDENLLTRLEWKQMLSICIEEIEYYKGNTQICISLKKPLKKEIIFSFFRSLIK